VYAGLTARNPGDAESRLFAAYPHWRLADLDPPNARAHLQAALDILRPLAAANRLDANRLTWIPQIEAALAALGP
jgi:hypothetical protein